MNPPRTFVAHATFPHSTSRTSTGCEKAPGRLCLASRTFLPLLLEVWKASLYHSLAGTFGQLGEGNTPQVPRAFSR